MLEKIFFKSPTKVHLGPDWAISDSNLQCYHKQIRKGVEETYPIVKIFVQAYSISPIGMMSILKIYAMNLRNSLTIGVTNKWKMSWMRTSQIVDGVTFGGSILPQLICKVEGIFFFWEKNVLSIKNCSLTVQNANVSISVKKTEMPTISTLDYQFKTSFWFWIFFPEFVPRYLGKL